MSENVNPETDVKQYYAIGPIAADENGYYVKYTDFASLTEDLARAENARMEAESFSVRRTNEWLEEGRKKLVLMDEVDDLRTALRAAQERAQIHANMVGTLASECERLRQERKGMVRVDVLLRWMQMWEGGAMKRGV